MLRLERLLRTEAAQPGVVPAARRRASATSTVRSCRGRTCGPSSPSRLARPHQRLRPARRVRQRPRLRRRRRPAPRLRRPRRRRRPGTGGRRPADRRRPTRRTCACSTSSPQTGTTSRSPGHTHGGQLCLPFKGALVTNCDLEPARAKGLHRHPASSRPGDPGSSWLHVSAGAGTSPYAQVRFCCRPEATLLTLAPRAASNRFLPALTHPLDSRRLQRAVAQFGSALRSGRRGRRFKSCQPDQCDVSRHRRHPDLRVQVRVLFISVASGRGLWVRRWAGSRGSGRG